MPQPRLSLLFGVVFARVLTTLFQERLSAGVGPWGEQLLKEVACEVARLGQLGDERRLFCLKSELCQAAVAVCQCGL